MSTRKMASLLLIAAMPLYVWAQGGRWGDDISLQAKGFLDTYHALRTEGQADWMASRTRFRGELKVQKEAASLFTSLNATYNALLTDRSGIALREAYLAYENAFLDLRAGRQIVVWGVADALRLNDYVSPVDYSEFLAQDYDDIRMPVNAIRAKFMWGSFATELLWIPIPEVCDLPTDRRNPWTMVPQDSPLPLTADLSSDRPAKRIANSEYGCRLSATLPGGDVALYALRTWNKMPAIETLPCEDGLSLLLMGRYRRMTMFGVDCAIPIGQVVLRGEGTAYLHEAQSARLGYHVTNRNTISGLLGVDWYPGADWTLSVQYCHRYVAGDMQGIQGYRNSGLATLRLAKQLLGNTLSLSTFAYVDVSNGALFNRFAAIYAVTDQIGVTLGYDYFYADKGMFALYKHNSQVWLKLKYSF